MSLTEPTTARELPPIREAGFWDGVTHSYIPADELNIDPSLKLHSAATTDIDPVTYEVIRYSLLNINLEHSDLVQRLCVSPITMLTRDFQVSLLTEVGDLVFLGPNLQYFSNSHSLSIKYVLENRVVEPGINPGDMFLSNDPYVGAPHQPDTAILAPVFVGDELFCWVANTMHLSDVGGSMPGSFCIDALDTFQEPLSWPPVKLVSDGKLRKEMEDLFIRQSRQRTAVQMDMRAAIGANEATRAKVVKLIERYGADVVKGVMQGTMDAGERLMAERLASIPDGRWSHRAYTEAAVPGDRTIYQYQINLTKQGAKLIVDNDGTDPQAGAINVTFAAFSGAVLAALTQMMVSDLAGAYGGAYRCVEFQPQPGLLNCCDFPAAVSPSGALTTEMQLNIASIAVSKMLASGDEASQELILGACIPHFYAYIAAGLTAEGQEFILPNTNGMMGSIGARPTRDGVDTGGHWWIPDGIAYNSEDVEAQNPLIMLYRKLLDAGLDGSGRTRGGAGFRECIAGYQSQIVQIVLHTGESFPKGQGIFGGNPGSLSTSKAKHKTNLFEQFAAGKVPANIDDIEGEDEPTDFKGAPIDMVDGDVFEWVSPSTAGYGDPLLRDPDAILADIVEQFLDPERAERIYGVVIRDGAVDKDATAARRLAIRRERLGGTEPQDPVAAPDGVRQIGEILHIVDGRWWSNGADLGASDENYRSACVVNESPIREIGPEFAGRDHEIADWFVFREYVCPVTGYRIDTEISRAGQPPLHDIVVHV
jgi:N-methylhydantoinase B